MKSEGSEGVCEVRESEQRRSVTVVAVVVVLLMIVAGHVTANSHLEDKSISRPVRFSLAVTIWASLCHA